MVSEERNRRYKRYYYKTSLRLEESKGLALETINISQGGIFFRSNELLDINKRINVSFLLPGDSKEISAVCSVVHNLETIPSRQYFVGVKFDRINNSSIDEFGSYLKEYFE